MEIRISETNEKNPLNIQGWKYPPVGRCIYCGSDGGEVGLRDEHIIPFSLGGNAVLPKASCRSCEAITSYLDGYLARHVFYDLRLQMGEQSRRAKKQPKKRAATLLIGGVENEVEFNISEHPHFLHLPVWGPPGIMQALAPSEQFSSYKSATFYSVPDGFFQKYPDGTNVVSQININHITFARAITKIAFSQMVAHLGGLSLIRPLMTPAIVLGRYRYVPYFVGTDFEGQTQPPDKAHRRHMISYGVYEHGRLRLIYVRVRLFADSGTPQNGTPIYEVLVGAIKDTAALALLGF